MGGTGEYSFASTIHHSFTIRCFRPKLSTEPLRQLLGLRLPPPPDSTHLLSASQRLTLVPERPATTLSGRSRGRNKAARGTRLTLQFSPPWFGGHMEKNST